MRLHLTNAILLLCAIASLAQAALSVELEIATERWLKAMTAFQTLSGWDLGLAPDAHGTADGSS